MLISAKEYAEKNNIEYAVLRYRIKKGDVPTVKRGRFLFVDDSFVFDPEDHRTNQWRIKDIAAGTRFGKLTVIRQDKKDSHGVYFLCQCDCGNTKIVRGYSLQSGETKSCGCIHDDLFADNAKEVKKKIYVKGTNANKIKSCTIPSNNTSGVLGVSWHRGARKWYARIAFKGRTYSLGFYDDINLAREARKAAEKELFGNFLEWYYEKYPEMDHRNR